MYGLAYLVGGAYAHLMIFFLQDKLINRLSTRIESVQALEERRSDIGAAKANGLVETIDVLTLEYDSAQTHDTRSRKRPQASLRDAWDRIKIIESPEEKHRAIMDFFKAHKSRLAHDRSYSGYPGVGARIVHMMEVYDNAVLYTLPKKVRRTLARKRRHDLNA